MARLHATILLAALTGLAAGCFETTGTPADAVAADDSSECGARPLVWCCGYQRDNPTCQCVDGQWQCGDYDLCMECPLELPGEVPGDLAPDAFDVPPDEVVAIDLPVDLPPDATLPDGRCHGASDCAQSQFCQAPGDPQPCGICMHPQKTCGGDVDCQADGQVCEWFKGPCACQQELGCVPKCGAAQGDTLCSAIETCDASGHCIEKMCVTDADCPKNFTCPIMDAPRCFRTTCSTDAGCPDGRCVNGTCRDDLGTCMYPVP